MTKKADFRFRIRQIRTHAAKLDTLIKDADPNGPAWETASSMASQAEEHLAMLVMRIERGEI